MFVCPECGTAQASPGLCPTDNVALADRGDDELLGETFGQYRIARLIGAGSVGSVYKGVRLETGDVVAIKVLSRECSDRKDAVKRYFAEAGAVNLLGHENIANILEVAIRPDGRAYIVMEYLDGASLGDVIRRAAGLTLGGMARIAGYVLAALGAAHAEGIVHGGLKPENIFISPSGRAKVLDFGIAKLQPEFSGSTTRAASVLGTLDYLAPEQARAQAIDPRTDLYTMGVIIYEFATGQLPFAASTLRDLLRQHSDQTPVPPATLRSGLSPAYERVILTAMAKDPAQRFASATDMAVALAEATPDLTLPKWEMITSPLVRRRIPIPTAPSHLGSDFAAAAGRSIVVPASTTAATAITPAAATSPNVVTTRTTPSIATQPTSPTTATSRTTPKTPTTPSKAKPRWVPVAAVIILGGVVAIALKLLHGTPAPAKTTAANPNAVKPAAPNRIAGPPMKPKIPPPPIAPSRPRADNFPAQKRNLANLSPLNAVDIDAEISRAITISKQTAADAVIQTIIATGVPSTGVANFTRNDSMMLMLTFVSPSNSKRPNNVASGMNDAPRCNFAYSVRPKIGTEILPMDGCKALQTGTGPHCTVKQIWAKAAAAGAPTNNTVAQVTYFGSWSFEIEGVVKKQFADDCSS